jgi:hypothetical protein
VAEISAADPKLYVIGSASELSRFGCFVRSKASIPAGTKVSLKITYDGSAFNGAGEVSHVLAETGMGFHFAPDTAEDEALLQAWLRQIGA